VVMLVVGARASSAAGAGEESKADQVLG
jgi:hypothetical protein